jgi:ferredoxin
LISAAASSSAAKWYYARNNESVGPLFAAQLKELAATGVLSPTDLVRQSGSPKWVVARKLKGLFALSAPSVPVATPAAPVAPKLVGIPLTYDLASRHQVLSEAQVVPDAARCVQCGICSYNCPIGIDVRAHAWRGRPINDSHCLTCSECVNRCPRGVLSFERIAMFTAK